MTDNLVTLSNLNLIRRGKSVLSNIDLAIKQGDFLTVIGPNGAGKSMLLKVILGLEVPTSGAIERQKELSIGYVPQRFIPDALLPLTVLRFLKLVKKVSDYKAKRILKEVGATRLRNRMIHTLSGGELQRVLLARALLHDPALLILDEPAQNVDIKGQLALYELIKTVHKERNCSVVIVSHDIHMVMAATTQVICLYQHICCHGKPELVAKDPEFKKMFGKDMAQMMAIYHHHHNHQHEG